MDFLLDGCQIKISLIFKQAFNLNNRLINFASYFKRKEKNEL